MLMCPPIVLALALGPSHWIAPSCHHPISVPSQHSDSWCAMDLPWPLSIQCATARSAVTGILDQLREHGGEALRNAFLDNIAQHDGVLFQNDLVIPDCICMLRFLGIADRTIGIILYYHTTLARHVMWWTRPALEAGLRLKQSQEIVPFDVTVFWRARIPWSPHLNVDPDWDWLWPLQVLWEVCRRCSCIARGRWPPRMPPIDKSEGPCVQCAFFCTSRCPSCPAYLCSWCDWHNRGHPGSAGMCWEWRHHFSIAGDEDYGHCILD